MATDYAQLTENLLGFYDFTNNVVLFEGAAGRQLLAPSARYKSLSQLTRTLLHWRHSGRALPKPAWKTPCRLLVASSRT